VQERRFGWSFVIGSDIRAIEKAVSDALQVAWIINGDRHAFGITRGLSFGASG
jgi:hypothetical protein